MNQELILKELEDAYNRQYRALGSQFKPYRLTDELKVEALIAGKFTIDWQRFDYENPVWWLCVVFDAEARSQENEQQKELTALYLWLRSEVVIGTCEVPELRKFLSQ